VTRTHSRAQARVTPRLRLPKRNHHPIKFFARSVCSAVDRDNLPHAQARSLARRSAALSQSTANIRWSLCPPFPCPNVIAWRHTRTRTEFQNRDCKTPFVTNQAFTKPDVRFQALRCGDDPADLMFVGLLMILGCHYPSRWSEQF
jgi:hypothetical protein